LGFTSGMNLVMYSKLVLIRQVHEFESVSMGFQSHSMSL
jgi:hypothetical protein